jgi:hypothetical protein
MAGSSSVVERDRVLDEIEVIVRARQVGQNLNIGLSREKERGVCVRRRSNPLLGIPRIATGALVFQIVKAKSVL